MDLVKFFMSVFTNVFYFFAMLFVHQVKHKNK